MKKLLGLFLTVGALFLPTVSHAGTVIKYIQSSTSTQVGTVIHQSSGTVDNFTAARATSAFITTNNISPFSGNGITMPLKGTTNNDSAAAGNVGEYMSSSTAAGMTASFPATGVFGDLVSITLTAGDWDVTFCAGGNGGSVNSSISFGLSATSGNSTSGLVVGQNWYDTVLPPVSGVNNAIYCIPNFRVVLTGSTAYYGKYLANYSGTIPKAGGTISARRRR